mgnify:CR=1 FL=1
MQKIIAEANYVYKSAKCDMRPIRIYLRAPHQLEGGDNWGCYCHVEGLFDNEIRMGGMCSMQALCLAIGFLRSELLHFEELGGTYYYPEELSTPVAARDLFGDNMSQFQEDGPGSV